MPGTNVAYPNKLRFDLSPEELTKYTEEIIAEGKQKYDELAAIPGDKRTFENTVRGLAYIDANLSTQASSCYFPAHVSTNKELRDASTAATKKLEEFSIEIETREDLYQAVLEYSKTPAAAKLEGIDKRLLQKTIQSFERSGLGLSEDKKQRIKEIKREMSTICIDFSRNLGEDVTKLPFTKEELDGLPEEFFEELPKEGDKYLVSLKYPELFPVMEQCKVEATRKKMEFANSSKCMKENTPMLEQVVALRQEEAKILGFKNHADYILDVRMAKNSDTVFKFLSELTERLAIPAKKDLARLLELKKKEKAERGEPFDGEVHVWEWKYYDTLLLQKEYQVDHDKIKEYFPIQKVTEGLLDIYQEILGLKFTEMPKEKIHVWHEDVKQFEVYDAETKDFMGHFYLDLFPREGKYGHAAEFDLQKGCEVAEGRQHSCAAMVANFTKPTATKPSLLKFDEVVTFFHEFGHVMHEICTRGQYSRFAGTNVERDFVEAPSQMLENWCYEPEVLARISGHYQDLSKPLPDELRKRLDDSKYVNEALKNRRQLHFGTFDMKIHITEGKVDSAPAWAASMKDIALTPAQPDTNGAAGFAHIMGGYSAGYYGYMWSKVFSSDMFTRFKKEGVLNPKVGKDYREMILAPGGSRDAMECLKEFLGREPTQDAFLEEIGAK